MGFCLFLVFFIIDVFIVLLFVCCVTLIQVRTRLEQLDEFEEGSTQETLNLSQQEYIERIEALSNTLTQAWQQDQRVRY